jgi:hypothetical protein
MDAEFRRIDGYRWVSHSVAPARGENPVIGDVFVS